MKKFFYYAMIGFILITFASCKKKCRCTTIEQEGYGMTGYTEETKVITLDKEAMEEINISKCSDLNVKESDGDYSYEVTCKSTL